MNAMPEPDWSSLAGRLIEARAHRCLSRRQLALRAGYSSESTVRRYEHGDIETPTDAIVFRLADALGCDPLWLLYGRGDAGWREEWKP